MSSVHDEAKTRRIQDAAPALFEALTMLMTQPNLDLGDLVYKVREREGLGWDGPLVIRWGVAVAAASVLLEKIERGGE